MIRTHPAHRPLYARVLRLRHLRPGGLMCFLLLEGSVLLAVLLSMAELVTWWSLVVLPVVVAVMVKVNDVIAGATRSQQPPPAVGLARVDGDPQLQEAQTVPGLSGSGEVPAQWSSDRSVPRRGGPARQRPHEPENVRAARKSDARRFD
ncbi:hypothetical protein Lfu02_53060 [Longispora fulva]|uniref:Uncharacterized protein n=1 Tax=Longispora fulva TaxID=619741 RepID=A0A8J7KTJ2_9ACTN|nr:hypothetical protein [Longispora fulva]MBG6140802.1 hypothetical protein [Longispora fulva]GIG60934.1 hypothetical protein Lfu02_53060 [Longispora fulva]